MQTRVLALAICFSAAFAAPAGAQTAGVDPASGFRIGNYRAPTPETAEGGATIDAAQAQRLAAGGAVLIDVLGAGEIEPDPFDGEWRGLPAHSNIPGSAWLPNVGLGAANAQMQRYFKENLAKLAGPPPGKPIILYCLADCWMSWNAVKRAAGWGYADLHWLREGTDGWRQAGLPLAPAAQPPAAPQD